MWSCDLGSYVYNARYARILDFKGDSQSTLQFIATTFYSY